MPRFDLPIEQIRTYQPAEEAPGDFDDFWADTLSDARGAGTAASVDAIDGPLSGFRVYDVTFAGFGGDPVRAWYLRPAGVTDPLPVVVEFLGYGAGRGFPHERLTWPAAGFAYVVMDTRGQGSLGGCPGVTPDLHGAGPSTPGFVTRGIEDPTSYYYRRVFTDAVRCVDHVRDLPGTDVSRIAVSGASQGGGIALAVSGLSSRVAAAMVDVPFLCHFRRAVGMTDQGSYSEVVRYLAVHRDAEETVFRTLSYFDGIHFARRATAPALFSTGLLDATCPPSTVFAAYNRYKGVDKEITVYPFNGHEGGGSHRWPVRASWLTRRVS